MLHSHWFTMRLVDNIDLRNRVLCVDNWFASLPLVIDIQARGGHLVGTISEKPYLPSKVIAQQGLEDGESLAVFNHKNNVNVVYKRVKATKTVRVMTTLHHEFTVVEDTKTEPVMFYNGAKSGVDGFNRMCAASSTSRKTKRWPLCIFYGILNIIMNNAYIIWRSRPGRKLNKHDFIMALAKDLAKPFAARRFDTISNLRLEIKFAIFRTFKLHEYERQLENDRQLVNDPEENLEEEHPGAQQPEAEVPDAEMPHPEAEHPVEEQPGAEIPQPGAEMPQPDAEHPVAIQDEAEVPQHIRIRPIVVQPRRLERRGSNRALAPLVVARPTLPSCPPQIPSGSFVSQNRMKCVICSLNNTTNRSWSSRNLCNRCLAPTCPIHTRRLCHDCFN